RARVLRLPREARQDLATDALDVIRREARLGERETQQLGGAGEVLLQRTQAAVELVLRGGKAQLPGKIVETAAKSGAVIGAGALVEQRSDHRRGTALPRRIERGAAGKRKADRHDRHRMVLDEPRLHT